MKIGNNIRIIREVRGYTREYMAEKLNLSLNGYGKIERNETKIKDDRMNKLALILDVDVDCIINLCDDMIFKNPINTYDKSSVLTEDNNILKYNPLLIKLINQVDKVIEHNNKLVTIIDNKSQ
jgi:transcriptional regulator with XRE-family HTH domain